jgi:hypothetical protein
MGVQEGDMAWENIEQRLKRALNVKITFPSGTVWLPDRHLIIDEWLTSVAQTDEELRELNIPRVRFLQNHWALEKLIQMTWHRPSDRRSIWAMYVGHEVYILFSEGFEYSVIAAIAPGNRPVDKQREVQRNEKSQQLSNRRLQKVKGQDEIQSPESSANRKKRVA